MTFTPKEIDAASEYLLRYYREAYGGPEPTPQQILKDQAECRAMVFGGERLIQAV